MGVTGIECRGCGGHRLSRAFPRHSTPDTRSLHALKLSPQEQLVAALGFFTLKPPSRASMKSNSLPVTYKALLGSTTTRTPAVSTRMSRLAGPSCKSILYCSPEQPPPTTATRSTPLGRPCLVSKELTFFAALWVSLIKRSSPVRNAGAAAGLGRVFAIIGPVPI